MKPTLLFTFLIIHFLSFSQNNIVAFLPDVISQFPNVRDFALSPNGNEIMFTAQSIMGNLSAIITMKKENNVWNKPEIASFSGQHFDLEPFFAYNGLKLYFVSTRPMDNTTTKPKDFDIWYVERTALNDHWSQPKNMGSPINTKYGEFYPSIANNGNFYFTRDNPTLKRKDDIYISTFKDGNYLEPTVLPNTVNSVGYEYNAFIAPDESYLLYGCYNREDGLGRGDLYISYNSELGWSEAKNLGKTINSNKMDYCPFVDAKTNTLYFTSKLDNTKTTFETPVSINGLLEEFKRYDNGLSRLYQISFDTVLNKE